MQGPVKMVARGMGIFACGMHGIWGNGYGGHRKMRGGAWMPCGHRKEKTTTKPGSDMNMG